MARIRSVKPEFWTSEQVMNMSRDARLLFIGIWTFCDDNGIHPASALSLKAKVLPGDSITADQVMVFIDEMIEQGLLDEYEASGRSFWRVTGWSRHQRIDHPTFRHPTCVTHNGDAGDAGDASDANGVRVTTHASKRLGGKQRQIVLRKLRERDGDVCHLCGNNSNLSIQSLAHNGEENASDISSLRLICSGCKRAKKRSSIKVTPSDAGGDAQVIAGDSTTEWSGVERIGGDKSNTPKPPEGGLVLVNPKSSAIELKTFLDQCKAKDERPMRDYTPLWAYAESAGLDSDLIALAWFEFRRRFLPGGTGEGKKYKNWRQAFRKYVEGNYFRLWAIDANDTYFLTTLGKQVQKIHEAKEAA